MTNRTLTNAAATTTAPLSSTAKSGTLPRSSPPHHHHQHQRPRPEDTTTFGYESPPDTPALHRDVFKWVQGLDLSQALKNCRRWVGAAYRGEDGAQEAPASEYVRMALRPVINPPHASHARAGTWPTASW